MSKHEFVLELGRAMHALGSPAYRVEDTMVACSRSFGMDGNFFATPTAIFLAIGEPGEEVKTTLLRVRPGDHDLGRLAALYAIRDAVVSGEMTPEVGRDEVRAVLAPRKDRPWVASSLSRRHAAAVVGAGSRTAFRITGQTSDNQRHRPFQWR